MAAEKIDIPLIIGGKEIRTNDMAASVMPHDHKHVLGTYHKATEQHVIQAIEARRADAGGGSSWPFEDRAAVLLKAAELLATTWRATLNAATMLGQSKTAFQAEIDAACELIDFWRFNVQLRAGTLTEQPESGRACGTSWSTAASKGSSTRCRRSTSRRSAATSRARRR